MTDTFLDRTGRDCPILGGDETSDLLSSDFLNIAILFSTL